MKKIFTLFAGLLLTAAVFAADRGPLVTISSKKNYKIMVDGRTYFGSSATLRLGHLNPGMHNIQVFEMRKGLFVKGERLVSSSSFKLGKKDVSISIDYFGRVTVIKKKGDNRYNDNRWDDKNDRNDRDDRRFDDEPVRRF